MKILLQLKIFRWVKKENPKTLKAIFNHLENIIVHEKKLITILK